VIEAEFTNVYTLNSIESLYCHDTDDLWFMFYRSSGIHLVLRNADGMHCAKLLPQIAILHGRVVPISLQCIDESWWPQGSPVFVLCWPRSSCHHLYGASGDS